MNKRSVNFVKNKKILYNVFSLKQCYKTVLCKTCNCERQYDSEVFVFMLINLIICCFLQ